MTKDSPEIAWIELSGDREDTKGLGARIAAGLKQGDCVLLEGDLGAGKTTLAQGILQALGVKEHIPSPTFTMVWSYETPRLAVSHYDLYRVEDSTEINELGIDDALDVGAALVEWPQRAENCFPADSLRVSLKLDENGTRVITLTGPKKWRDILMGTQDVA